MKKIVLFLAVLFTVFSTSLTAQVAIGTDQNPHGGAVLDLSQASGQNGLGLLLPRVFFLTLTVFPSFVSFLLLINRDLA